MGKSRRNRGGASQRRDPIAKPTKPPSDPELAALREAKILPIINDLKNTDPKSRSAAATAITNLIQDTRCRKLLLREQIVHTILTQTLTDVALESRAAGWGILQVLAQEEEADFGVHLFRSDISTAIEYGAKSVGEKLLSQNPAFSKAPKADRTFTVSITASLVALLTALAEAGDEILEAISSNATITDFLFLLIIYCGQVADDSDSLFNIRGDVLACLMILTEDNGNLAKRLVTNAECYQALSTLRNEVTGDGVLACATLHNVFAALDSLKNAPYVPEADDSLLIPTLAKTITGVQLGHIAANGSDGWSNPVEQQQLALETLASIGTTLNSANLDVAAPTKKEETTGPKDDEDMGDADGEGSEIEDGEGGGGGGGDNHDEDEDEEMDQDEMEADMEMVTGSADGPDDEANIDDMPVLKALLQTALPELIRIASFQPSNDDTLRLQSHALSALNNIAWSISLVDFSDDQNAGIQKAWLPIGRTLWERVITPILSSDTADVSLATQVTGLAWAVSRSLGGKTPLSGDEHRKFISLYQATKSMDPQDSEDPFQRLGVKCIGVLGQLAMDPAPASLNREIGTFMVTLLAGLPDATPAADAVEAFNQLFDIYGNEELSCDAQVFWKDSFLNHLEAVVPKARAMAKSVDKKTQPELRTRAEEAVLNLGRFIVYKKKNRPQGV
ncbi:hypothetical protein QQS21_011847 [Conoideocrella luteorostrata]|uniref:SYO1-like TPR repeats domain-containing protein n=1 Tax=Conoideocrella luteorostrata TaxID=1105319 RepID=A0AAJ0FSZ5_9HYPO|nr:hypothetical protein QQS21_011847 [Conoideocrella luteorostrata]